MENELLDDFIAESEYYKKFQAVDIPRVKVLDEEGNIVCTGYYMLHFNRTPSPFDDEYKEEDVEHIVVKDQESDWNMSRGIEAKLVTPPHTIELL